MELEIILPKNIILLLLRDSTHQHTITSLAKELKVTRVGVWKAMKKLERQKVVNVQAIGAGKTSTYLLTLNWTPIVEKTLEIYLLEESLHQKRWVTSFEALKNHVGFSILYGSILYTPEQANDIDIINVVKDKGRFIKIDTIIQTIQKTQMKKIHAISFTEGEFKEELQKKNKAFLDAVKKGVILYGQEKFINFMKEVR